MDLRSDGPRTRIVTDLAVRDRYTAAWPAELAPPTMYTSWPVQPVASVSAEP